MNGSERHNQSSHFRSEVNEGSCSRLRDGGMGGKAANGQRIKSCSILTTTPNAVGSKVHDGMPVIHSRDDYDVWLDPGRTNVDAISDLLKPLNASLMRVYPGCRRINQVQNDDKDCSRLVTQDQPPGSFFA